LSSAAADFLSRETILLICNRVLRKKNWGAQKLVFGEGLNLVQDFGIIAIFLEPVVECALIIPGFCSSSES
jgi:hypothetical protein